MRISDWSSDVCSSDLLALARALLKRPDLLVANEAISVLDGAGQNRLVERILDRRRGQGVIWTLQRPEMAALFDSILVMRDGRLVEQGSYDELTGRDSDFKGLVDQEERAGRRHGEVGPNKQKARRGRRREEEGGGREE